MTEILLVLLTAALGATLVIEEIRVRSVEAVNVELREIYEDTRDELVQTQRNLERTENELKYLKELFNRPIVATLSDKQAGDLTQALLTYAASLQKPDLLN